MPGGGMFFADLGTNIEVIMDEKMPDDTNIIVKIGRDGIMFYMNPNRMYNTMNNKDAIIGSLNKKITEFIHQFKSKISLKRDEGSDNRNILLKDVVCDKLKDKSHVYLLEEEEIVFAIARMMLSKQEMKEEKSLIEKRALEKAQNKIDNDGKEKKK